MIASQRLGCKVPIGECGSCRNFRDIWLVEIGCVLVKTLILVPKNHWRISVYPEERLLKEIVKARTSNLEGLNCSVRWPPAHAWYGSRLPVLALAHIAEQEHASRMPARLTGFLATGYVNRNLGKQTWDFSKL